MRQTRCATYRAGEGRCSCAPKSSMYWSKPSSQSKTRKCRNGSVPQKQLLRESWRALAVRTAIPRPQAERPKSIKDRQMKSVAGVRIALLRAIAAVPHGFLFHRRSPSSSSHHGKKQTGETKCRSRQQTFMGRLKATKSDSQMQSERGLYNTP